MASIKKRRIIDRRKKERDAVKEAIRIKKFEASEKKKEAQKKRRELSDLLGFDKLLKNLKSQKIKNEL